MPEFSKTSKERLYTCDPKLIKLFNEVIKQFDCSIFCGYRNEHDQNHAFEKGYSQVQWPNGRHNVYPSKAVDAGPWYPGDNIRWEDIHGFIHFAGYVRGVADQMGIPIGWGGDWDRDFDLLDEGFRDYPHFYLTFP